MNSDYIIVPANDGNHMEDRSHGIPVLDNAS